MEYPMDKEIQICSDKISGVIRGLTLENLLESI